MTKWRPRGQLKLQGHFECLPGEWGRGQQLPPWRCIKYSYPDPDRQGRPGSRASAHLTHASTKFANIFAFHFYFSLIFIYMSVCVYQCVCVCEFYANIVIRALNCDYFPLVPLLQCNPIPAPQPAPALVCSLPLCLRFNAPPWTILCPL